MANVSFVARVSVVAAQVSAVPLVFAVPQTIYLPRAASAGLAGYVSGGVPPYGSFARASGSLPSGITVASDGTITATSGASLGDSGTLTFRVTDGAMATAYSGPVVLRTYDPYAAVPASGIAKMVSPANAANAVKPPQHDVGAWRYATFGSYGSGVFNPHYSTNGAFVVASSGGHGHPKFFGDLVFDFDTMEWAYTPCANPGVVDTMAPTPYSQMNADPWFEMLSSLPDNVPGPPHPYKNMQVIPPSKGGGAKGSMIWIGRAAVANTGGGDTGVAHSYDLVTHKWKRQSVGGSGYRSVESATAYDPVKNRYYQMYPGLQYVEKLLYLDGSDWSFKTEAKFPNWGPSVDGMATNMWIQEGGGVRALMVNRSYRLFAINLDAPASGFIEVFASGEPIDADYSNPVLHVAQNIVYRRLSPNGQGQRLQRWTPPVGSPISGVWSIDSVALGGDPIPDHRAANIDTSAYRNLMYLPALQMLAWVTANGVYLLNP